MGTRRMKPKVEIFPVVRDYIALVKKAERYRDAGNYTLAEKYAARATRQGYVMNAAAWRQVMAVTMSERLKKRKS